MVIAVENAPINGPSPCPKNRRNLSKPVEKSNAKNTTIFHGKLRARAVMKKKENRSEENDAAIEARKQRPIQIQLQ